MPRYEVTLPIAGYAIVSVEADSEEAAIDAAIEQGVTLKDVVEWDVYNPIVQGNVLYASPNHASAELIED